MSVPDRAALLERFLQHSKHTDFCAKWQFTKPSLPYLPALVLSDSAECTCGLDELLRACRDLLRAPAPPRPTREQVESLWEELGGDLCICQRPEVSHWCEKCQQRLQMLTEAFQRFAAPAPEGWQPIETAPKDDTVVIGFDPTRDDIDPEETGTGGVEFMRWRDGGWIDPCTHSMKPTHWMPLPDPPVSGADTR